MNQARTQISEIITKLNSLLKKKNFTRQMRNIWILRNFASKYPTLQKKFLRVAPQLKYGLCICYNL